MASAPSSPAMAAATGSSPAASLTAQLTPRSKIRALMAQVSDDSEDEAPAGPSKSRRPLAEKTERANRGPDISLELQNLEKRQETTQSEARNVGKASGPAETSNKGQDDLFETDNTPVNAYERVREQMLHSNVFTKDSTVTVHDGEDSDAEDDDVALPKGRMASRLQGGANEPAPTTTVVSSLQAEETQPLSSPGQDSKESRSDPDPQDKPAEGPFRRGRFLLRKKVNDLDTSPEKEHADDEPASSPNRQASQNGADTAITAEGDDQSMSSNSRFLELVARKRQEREAKEAEEEQAREEKLARMREELENREASPAKKQKRSLQRRRTSISPDAMSEDDPEVEAEIDKKLTQQSRPTRKASKKAMEEMSRETQRLSRSMQLAHEARTRKKITKESLLEKFNFRQPGGAVSTTTTSRAVQSSATNSSAPASDVEGAKEHQTPPTSPIDASPNARNPSKQLATGLVGSLLSIEQPLDENDALPNFDAGSFVKPPESNGAEKVAVTLAQDPKAAGQARQKQSLQHRPVKVYTVTTQTHPHGNHDDSDSDLEVMSQKRSRVFAAFDRVQPASKKGVEGKAMLNLRALAQLRSPGKKSAKTTTNSASLQASLRKKARQQAARERDEKIQDLRERGIIVRTEEEKEHDREQMEDILERARRENDELAQREKDARKKAALANGEEPPSSDEDEDYDGGEGEVNDDGMELEISGSEDEGEGEADDDEESFEDEDGEAAAPDVDSGLVLDQAKEAGEDSEGEESAEQASESEAEAAPAPAQRRGRGLRIVDDDDEDEVPTTLSFQRTPAPAVVNPFMQMGSAKKDAPMGLTQAFAATMADSQDYDMPDTQEQDSIAALSAMPAPDFDVPLQDTPFQSTHLADGNLLDVDLHFTQPQAPEDSLPHATQQPTQTDVPDPTQDAGFGMSSPAGQRFANSIPSTLDTVMIDSATVAETPKPKRKVRLQRRNRAVATFSDSEHDGDADSEADADSEPDITADAFNVMKNAAIKALKTKEQEAFDKKKSKAQEMVEEQAAESEDEYAGLGGASDDDSAGELDEETRKMIEDGEVDVDERTLAAFHANKERATDEKAVERLFKDINNGGLRRKRRASLELTDSEDDAEDRRRRKQAEFARMRKALLADENVGQIAEDPKKAAFMRCIEDLEDAGLGSEDDLVDEALTNEVRADADFAKEALAVEAPAGTERADDAAEQSTQEVPESQPNAASAALALQSAKRKRPVEPLPQAAGSKLPRAPAALRRRPRQERSHHRPTTLAEMRDNISFLTEDPHSMLGEAPSDEEAEGRAEHSARAESEGGEQPFGQPIRSESGSTSASSSSYSSVSVFISHHRSGASAVVDRLQVKRTASLNAATAAGARMAFHDPAATASVPGFKVPGLLRRATADALGGADRYGISHGARSGATTSATERGAGGHREGGVFVRKTSSKKMSVNFSVREEEKRTLVEGVERRRADQVRKVAEGRRHVLGVLGSGLWE